MIPRSERFSAARFPRTAKTVFASDVFLVKAVPNAAGRNRFQAVISAKRIPSAVRRRFWKRRILHRAKSLPNTGQDILFVANRGMKEATLAVLQEEFQKLRARLH